MFNAIESSFIYEANELFDKLYSLGPHTIGIAFHYYVFFRTQFVKFIHSRNILRVMPAE